ncbi:hypothetical protein L195_g042236, partial [Trifolium pratense]
KLAMHQIAIIRRIVRQVHILAPLNVLEWAMLMVAVVTRARLYAVV